MADPVRTAELAQIERYRFEVRFPNRPYGPSVLDEAPPLGTGAGPNPVESLATAIGHCMGSTLVNTLERAHVEVTPLRTFVDVEVGRNEKGRLRVRSIALSIQTAPLHPEDRERFDRSVALFEDFCTVSGAVREGIPIRSVVAPPSP
jgi:uncharacterized OsmC-like protein